MTEISRSLWREGGLDLARRKYVFLSVYEVSRLDLYQRCGVVIWGDTRLQNGSITVVGSIAVDS